MKPAIEINPTQPTATAKTVLVFAITLLLHAGETATPPPRAAAQWITPTIDIRARYEFGDVDHYDPSNAFTFRERLGLKTMAWNGFSAFIEGEFSQALVDDYNGGARGADPFDPGKTLIADPETNELNQGYLQYEGFDTLARVGRQRVIYDNAAFIGNVGWRQNEQTYDAVSFSNKSIDELTFNYAYLNQINRIFGSDADAPLWVTGNVQDLAANVNLFDILGSLACRPQGRLATENDAA